MHILVKAKPPLARRCRCGMCFDAAGQLMDANKKELAMLRTDPWLMVMEADAPDAEKKAEDANDDAKKSGKTNKSTQQAE